jgi:hypothetical protein
MTNPCMRGSAPGRAQHADQRSGSFKSGHEKRGGRQRGTPNVMSIDYKKAMLEAAYRVGNDGNGKDGLVGYLSWVAFRHAPIFCNALGSLLPLEFAESNNTSQEPRRTIEEINQWLRDYVGLTSENRTREQTVHLESRSPWDWTGQPFPVGSLMQIAVADPKSFCKLLAATLPKLSAKQRRLWEWSRPETGAA